MKKIMNLHRLNFSSKIVILNYYIKKIFGIRPSLKQSHTRDYFNHLIKFDAFYKGEINDDFITFYPKWDITIKIRKAPSSDVLVFNQIFIDEEYKPVVEIFKKNFNNHSNLIIIDGGCNIGLTSLYLSNYFNDSNFICIEPDAQNFESLSLNLDNKNIKKLHKIKGGLWSKNIYLKILTDFRDKREWAFRVEETSEKTDLPSFSINYLVKQYALEAIDILKIDIEGSEKEVFTNPNADVSFLLITKCVAIEIHDEFECRDEINTILTNYGFEFFSSGELTIGINKNL
jgi:FkbM family methyltransferase